MLIRERDDKPIAVIEAKGLGNSLEDDETAQAHIYANQAGIDYMIVTDGDTWKMFKAYGRGVLEDRQIMEFQLSEDLSHECLLQALRIWNPNLATGNPKEAMKPVLDSPDDKMKDDPAAPALDDPLDDEPDDFADEDAKVITLILKDNDTSEIYRRKHKSYRAAWIECCEILATIRGGQFKKLSGIKLLEKQQKSWFSEDPDALRHPHQIKGTDIYIETNFNPTGIKQYVKPLAEYFGCEASITD